MPALRGIDRQNLRGVVLAGNSRCGFGIWEFFIQWDVGEDMNTYIHRFLEILESMFENIKITLRINFCENRLTETAKITKIFVDAGSTLKRFRARARGRGARILKRTCHVTVVVKEQDGRNS